MVHKGGYLTVPELCDIVPLQETFGEERGKVGEGQDRYRLSWGLARREG